MDAGQPGAGWFAVLDPVVLLVHTYDELVHPRSESLVCERSQCLPAIWDEAVLNVILNDF